MKIVRSFTSLFLAATALSLTSCAAVYNQAYQKSVAEYSAGTVKSPEGPWEGTWTTTSNGHTGPLRCIVTEDKTDPGKYNFKYRASWMNFFSGTFNVKYDVDRRWSSYIVDGTEDLGFFGEFQHDAKITPSSFKASYSKSDSEDLGGFQMKRPRKE